MPGGSGDGSVRAWIALGGNLGDRAAILASAVERLRACGVTVRRLSHAYETRPEGGAAEPPYLNAVAELETTLPPEALLRTLQGIEEALGRPRPHLTGPRTCDLDLLSYDDLVTETPGLVLPHPRLHRRGFVLVPLCELNVHWRHPGTGLAGGELLAGLSLAPGEVRLHGPLPLEEALIAGPSGR